MQDRFICNCIDPAVIVTFYTERIYLKIKRKWKFTLISSNRLDLINIDVDRFSSGEAIAGANVTLPPTRMDTLYDLQNLPDPDPNQLKSFDRLGGALRDRD